MINLEEIVIVNVAGVLILVQSMFSRIDHNKERHLSDRLLNSMIGITLGALVAEILTFVIDGKAGTLIHVLQYILNGYLFLASCGVGTLWVFYVDYRIYHSRKRLRKLMIPRVSTFAIIAVLIVCDMFGAGIIFSVTEQNVYLRGEFAFLPYLVLLYDYCVTIVMSVFSVKRNNHIQFFPVLYFVITFFIGTVVQGMKYGITAGWFSASLSFMFLQVQLNNQNAFVDDLSGLYNRKYYHYIINKMIGSRKNEMISGIMMDINQFKSINDRFGHTAGDDAIHNLGKIISRVTTEQDTAFRHAGDEFIIISIIEREQDAINLIEALNQKISEFNEVSEKPYKLSLAIGFAVCSTEDLDSDTFLRQMDEKMYEAKAEYYAQTEKECVSV